MAELRETSEETHKAVADWGDIKLSVLDAPQYARWEEL
jgi:hypothetical protein